MDKKSSACSKISVSKLSADASGGKGSVEQEAGAQLATGLIEDMVLNKPSPLGKRPAQTSQLQNLMPMSFDEMMGGEASVEKQKEDDDGKVMKRQKLLQDT